MNPDHPILEAVMMLGGGCLPIGLMVYLVQKIRDDYEKTHRVVLSERAHARKMRFRGAFWPAMLILAGLCLLTIPWIARPGRNPPQGGPPPLIPVLLLALVCFAAAPKVWLTYRWKRLAGPVKPKPKLAGASLPSPTTPRWVWFVVLIVFGSCLYFLAPKRAFKGDPQPQPAPSGWLCLGAIGFVVAVIAIQWMRQRDPVWNRIYRRALDGDLAGAIAELHHEILDQGPTANRINGLVVLLHQNKDHPAAVEWARKGLALAPDNDALRSNFALALVESGQAAEAEPIFAEMAARDNANLVYITNYAHTLTKLGRYDEAQGQLQAAEARLATILLATRGYKPQIRGIIAELRVKIAEARGLKDASELFPEL